MARRQRKGRRGSDGHLVSHPEGLKPDPPHGRYIGTEHSAVRPRWEPSEVPSANQHFRAKCVSVSMSKPAMKTNVTITCLIFAKNRRKIEQEILIEGDITAPSLHAFSARPELLSATHVIGCVELPCSRCFQRANIAFNLFGNRIFGNFQVITRLEIHPERRTVVEVAREAQGCVSSNCAFLVDDIGDSLR